MRCDDVRATLQGNVYEKTQASPEVRTHLEECADCRAYGAQAEELTRLLDLDEDVEPRPGFDTRFFARLEELKAERDKASWWRRWPVWVAAASLSMSAAAAVVLLGVQPPATPTLESDLALAMELEMLEDLDLVRQLDEVEVYAVLAQLEVEDLDAMLSATLREGMPQ